MRRLFAALLLASTSALAQAPVTYQEKERPSRLLDLTVLAGGGVEGFTGSMASELEPGFAWGATVGIFPFSYLGAELAYTGAVHEFDLKTNISGGAGGGADVVRNGGHAALNVGLTDQPVQPYALAGIGFESYEVLNPILGFQDDTVGYVPLGGGVRYRWKSFTADARFSFNVLFSNAFALEVAQGVVLAQDARNGTRWDGAVRMGATF
ncbi:MAG: hypothetical protein ACOZIN_02420 [Myxococcota bacterium]